MLNKLKDMTGYNIRYHMQKLPIKFPNKKGLLELTPPPLKWFSLFPNKENFWFFSDPSLPLGSKSLSLLFFLRSSHRKLFSCFYNFSWWISIMNGWNYKVEILKMSTHIVSIFCTIHNCAIGTLQFTMKCLIFND